MMFKRIKGKHSRSFRQKEKAYRDLKIVECYARGCSDGLMQEMFGLSPKYMRQIYRDTVRRLNDVGSTFVEDTRAGRGG